MFQNRIHHFPNVIARFQFFYKINHKCAHVRIDRSMSTFAQDIVVFCCTILKINGKWWMSNLSIRDFSLSLRTYFDLFHHCFSKGTGFRCDTNVHIVFRSFKAKKRKSFDVKHSIPSDRIFLPRWIMICVSSILLIIYIDLSEESKESMKQFTFFFVSRLPYPNFNNVKRILWSFIVEFFQHGE